MLQNGDAQMAELVRELGELRDFKVRFEAWVNDKLTTEKAAMAAAQENIQSLEKEVDDLRTHEAIHATAVYDITEELGHARVRIDALAHENQALRAKLAAGPADVPRGAGMATFICLLYTSDAADE